MFGRAAAAAAIVPAIVSQPILIRNKRFLLDEMTLRNASQFAIFYIYENPKLLFPFLTSCYLIFPL